MDVMEVMKDYTCPICMEVAPKCLVLKTCAHKFCDTCQKNIKKSCPVCRQEFTKTDLKKQDDSKKMKNEFIKCLCGTEYNLYEFKDHHEECDAINKVNEESKSNLLDKRKMKETVNRSTFGCPCCKLTNLDRKALVEHILKKHKKNKAVCPICACQPWGNAQQITHLKTHMEVRHQFDYDTYTVYLLIVHKSDLQSKGLRYG